MPYRIEWIEQFPGRVNTNLSTHLLSGCDGISYAIDVGDCYKKSQR